MFGILSKKLSTIFLRVTGRLTMTDKNLKETLREVTDALLKADVPYSLVRAFMIEVNDDIIGKKVLSSFNPGEQLIQVVHDRLLAFFGGRNTTVFSFKTPSVVMVMGLQGSGKTTSLAKLAHYVIQQAKKEGKTLKILFASVDFHRPAAVEQLAKLAKKLKVKFFRSKDPDATIAAYDINKEFRGGDYDMLFLDTAGRLHMDPRLMNELSSIDRQVAPAYKIFVMDAMTGQQSLTIAKIFENQIGFSSALLTKMDSDSHGGVAFSFRYELGKPISFLGTGEKIGDLEPFHPERMVKRILGMGDLATLAEKADEKMRKSEQERMYRSLSSGVFTLEDFAGQIDMMAKVGSLKQIAGYLPGMGTVQLTPDKLEQGEADIKKFRALIHSMTKKERSYPKMLDRSRKERIAKGAGAAVTDINLLLNRFEESQQFVKLFKRFGHFQNFFRK